MLLYILSSSLPGQGNKYYGSICENKKGILRCPGTQTITVKFANYGRTRFFKCGMGFNTKCISETSLKVVSLYLNVHLDFSWQPGTGLETRLKL